MFENVINFIQETYQIKNFIPLHEPKFVGNEKKYLNECIDSMFVSSVCKFVDEFEEKIANYTGSKYAIAVDGAADNASIRIFYDEGHNKIPDFYGRCINSNIFNQDYGCI